MNKRYEQSPRFNAAGLATGSIPALIVAMAISVFFKIQPVEARPSTTVAHTIRAPRTTSIPRTSKQAFRQ